MATFNATSGADNFVGDGADDIFQIVADSVQSGDAFDGGGGSDALSFFDSNVTWDFRAATVSSIEVLSFHAGGTTTETAQFGSSQVNAGFLSALLVASTNGTGVVEVYMDNTSFSAGNWVFSYSGLGASVSVKLYGTSANEQITGSTLADYISGGGGDDTLIGGLGADTMVGGAGDDAYYVDNASDVTTELAGGGMDTVYTALSALTLASEVEALTFVGGGNFTGVGNTGANVITSGGGDDTLTGGAGVDTLSAGGGNDVLQINPGDVTGSEVYDGGDGGSDALSFFGSNVTWDFRAATVSGIEALSFHASGSTTETAQFGSSQVSAGFPSALIVASTTGAGVVEVYMDGASFSAANWTFSYSGLGASVSVKLYGTSANEQITGSTLADYISGGGGDDTLIGGLGADTMVGDSGSDILVGGAGDDSLDGGSESDTASYAGGAAVSVSLALAGVQNTLGQGSDTLSSIENLIGSSFADTLIGNAAANTLDGGAGADAMTGGDGNDTYVVDNAGDVVTENALEGTDTVQSSITYSIAALANVENVTLTGGGAIDATGNGGANALTGNGATNLLNGGGGADSMAGGDGNDTYVVDNAGDVVTENALEGTDTVQSSITYSIAALANVENVTLTGGGAIDATGNGGANALTGNGAANTLDGGAGADVMAGGGGDDIYIVDNSGDVVTESGGAGADTVRTSLSAYVAPANVETILYTGAGAFTVVAGSTAITLTGGAGGDTLIGSTAGGFLGGGDGADVLWFYGATTLSGGNGFDYAIQLDAAGQTRSIGAAGIEVYVANSGNDTINSSSAAVTTIIYGGAGNDTLTQSAIGGYAFGQDGDDALLGGDGQDIFLGGAGFDNIMGFGGNDVLYIDSADGIAFDGGTGVDYAIVDTAAAVNVDLTTNNVEVFIGNLGNDTINASGTSGPMGLYGFGGDDVMASGTSGGNQMFGQNGNDILNSGAGGDVVLGGNGADQLFGNGGDDTLLGEAGDDLLVGGTGADVLWGGSGNDTFRISSAGLGAEQDVIADFGDSGGNDDLINFTGITAGQVTITNASGGALLSIAGGYSLFVIGATAASIQDDLLFV
jgi:Ca2+-binding RTX toxin-like protein